MFCYGLTYRLLVVMHIGVGKHPDGGNRRTSGDGALGAPRRGALQVRRCKRRAHGAGWRPRPARLPRNPPPPRPQRDGDGAGAHGDVEDLHPEPHGDQGVDTLMEEEGKALHHLHFVVIL